MKLERTGEKFVFVLGDGEKEQLCEVLNLYPCVPSAHFVPTKKGRAPKSSQKLLDEALQEQRAENKKQVQALLADPRHFGREQNGWRLAFSGAELEWLLQVLNDIRVGSWILLGSPDEDDGRELPEFDADTAPHFWAMGVSGYFQTGFLEALESDA